MCHAQVARDRGVVDDDHSSGGKRGAEEIRAGEGTLGTEMRAAVVQRTAGRLCCTEVARSTTTPG